jgi:DNA helicase-2/ATP-dependent DNA helicase PcrA
MDLSRAIELEDSDQLIGIENHFKLCAGPGAGKTRFLVNHIKNVIKNSKRLKKARKIACITYTNIGVETLADRLENSLDYVEISTIHSFLYKNVIKPYSWLLEDKYDLNIAEIDGHQDFIARISILKEWLRQTNQYVGDYAQLQKDMQRAATYFDNEELKWKLKPPSESAIRFDSIIEYKKLCWQQGFLSHNDVLFLSYKIIQKSEEVREVLRAKFPYLFVDEFQDTTPVQTEIIKMLAEKETVVGVIGDTAQSIYGFLGSSVESFIDFDLDDMILYKIEDNRRSTKEIIDVLNNLRSNGDFQQSSPDNLSGEVPKILTGNFNFAYEYVDNLLEEDFHTLSYTNKATNMMRFKLEEYPEVMSLRDLLTEDSDFKRRELLFNIIKAVESAVDKNFKDGLRYMLRAYRKSSDFTEKDGFRNLQRLIDCYDEYKNLTLKKFHNDFLYDYFDTDEISSRIGNSGGPHDLYSNLKYNKVALTINFDNDDSCYRTIHKAKGAEFDNLLLIIPPEEKECFMTFICDTDLGNKESHRRYYVALSRAKKNLFVNLSDLDEGEKEKLVEAGFEIEAV